MKYFIFFLIICTSCISYDQETEIKFQENQKLMLSYMEEIGLANSPFWQPFTEDQLDKQRKKRLALMSETELKTFIDNKTANIPRIEEGSKRSKAYFREIEGIKDPQQCYDILTMKYADIIVKQASK